MSPRHVFAIACLTILALAPIGAQSRIVQLNDTGWKLLQSGDAAGATIAFAEALETEPDNPILLLGAGVSAHVQGRVKDATTRLRRALELEPSLTPASVFLGQLAYDAGDTALAISTYEKALTYAPNDEQILSNLRSWRADAEVDRRFIERRSDRFRVMFQGHADQALAARATELLESSFWEIGTVLGAYPSDPVVVMLYTEKQFRDITRAPEWAGGLYDGRIRVPAAGAAQSPQLFERVLVHELTHAMIASIAPRGVPAWMHEGLAQYFEGHDVGAARRRLAQAGQVVPLRLLEGSFGRLTAAQALVAYDQSLVVVDNILKRPGLNWSALLRALDESGRPEYTLDNFGLPYTGLEAEIAGGTTATAASRSR